MTCRLLLLMLMVLPVSACANEAKEEGACERFKFDGGVEVYARPDMVKSLNARLEFGAPRNVISMELNVPALERFGAAEEVHLSAFFRPLRPSDEPECLELAGSGLTRCYMQLPGHPLQMSVVFGQDHRTPLPALMREISSLVEMTVLNCKPRP